MAFEIKNINFFEDSFESIVFFEESYLFFHGEVLDDRGSSSIELQNNENCIHKEIKFIPQNSTLVIKDTTGEVSFPSFKLIEYLKELNIDNILIDSTTLSIAEILNLIHAYNILDLNVKIKIMYIEPEDYNGVESKIDLSYLDYHLTERNHGILDIRPYNSFIDSTNPEEKAEVIVFLGFEEDRLGKIFEYDQNQKYESFTPIIGLPAYKVGWENTSIIKNIRHFNNEFRRFEFAGANNPYRVNEVLTQLYKSKESNKFVVATLGTKPCAVGTSIFLVNNFKVKNNDVGILYDFPIKKNKRTKGISKVFIYDLEKTST